MAGIWDNLLKIGTAVVPAVLGSVATRKAAKAGEKGANEARALAQAQYEQSRADLEPWRKEGVTALRWLSRAATPGKMSSKRIAEHVQGTPGYEFARDEANRNFSNMFSRRSSGAGGMTQGRTGKEFMRWNEERLTRPAYESWLNLNKTLAGYGGQGTSASTALGADNAALQGRLGILAHDADAGGTVGQANIWGNAFQNLARQFQPDPAGDAYAAYLRSITNRSAGSVA